MVGLSKPQQPAQAEGWPDINPETLRSLPPVLRAVVRALGWVRAGEFLQQHGGLVEHIPLHKKAFLGLDEGESSRLREALSLFLEGGRRDVQLPKSDKLLKRLRNHNFAADALHLSNRELARRYGVTMRHVLNLKNQLEEGAENPQNQLNLWSN